MASTAADTGLRGAVHGPVYSVYSVQCTVQSVQRGRGPRMITPGPGRYCMQQPRVGRGIATHITGRRLSTGERCTLVTLTLPSCWLQEEENINTDSSGCNENKQDELLKGKKKSRFITLNHWHRTLSTSLFIAIVI